MNRELLKRLGQLAKPKKPNAKKASENIQIDQVPAGRFFMEIPEDGMPRIDDPVYHKSEAGEISSSRFGGNSFIGVDREYFAQKLFTIVSKPNWIG